jgi:hypothetical protein
MFIRGVSAPGPVWAPDGVGYTPEPNDDLEGDGGSGGAAGEEKTPAWAKQMSESMGGMTQMFRGLIDEARANRGKPVEPEPEPEDDEIDTVDLETMSRAQFAQWMSEQLVKSVNKNVVEPLNQQIREIKNTTTGHQLKGAVQELAGKHKDFWDWQGEMIELAMEYPSLPPHRLYTLARAENPAKAAKIDKKLNPAGDGSKKVKIGFGGLTPSQSGSGSRTRSMKPQEAAKSAWAETVAALGGEPDFDEDDE